MLETVYDSHLVMKTSKLSYHSDYLSDPDKLSKYISAFPQVTESKTRRKTMQEFMENFKVNEEQAKIAGVCAGLADYFGIKVAYIRLIFGVVVLASTELGIFVALGYAYLAGWFQKDYLWNKMNKKVRNHFIFLMTVLIILPLFGREILEIASDFISQVMAWLTALI